MRVNLVCPRCSYGFSVEQAREYVCPNPDCRHTWRNLSVTLAGAFTTEGRRARPELAVRSGERAGLVFPVDRPSVVLGRADDCDITFSNLAISRRHAEVLLIGDECVLVDLDSRLGTYVNGQRAHRTQLRMGDQILISGVLIEFRVRYEATGDVAVLPPQEDAVSTRKGGRLHVIRCGEVEVDRIRLAGDKLTVGRHADRDAFIDHPLISRRHAALLRDEGGWSVVDTKSRNGTFVNGRAVIQARIERGDRVQFGPVRFLYDGDALVHQESHNQVTLEAHDLTVRTERGTTILDGVGVRIAPSQFVGIIGPSGSGKTTLLNALSGFRRASAGTVTVNGRDLYAEYSTFKTGMGYVPQDDIIHTELTPDAALRYAARLRLPHDTSAEEVERLVHETLEILGLLERRALPIHRLSGGQRKRVSLGVELLTRASMIFMDEPTSGLDPGTEARMMRLFRKLADQGRTLVMTTHVMENIDALDAVAVLYEGRLVYFGPPAEMMAHFDIERATHLYDTLATRSAEEWSALYADSAARREHLGEAPPETTGVLMQAGESARPPALLPLAQLRTLASRYVRILAGAPRNAALMAVQPAIIFPAICGVFQHAGTILFLSALAMFWLGCTNAAREIVKERAVYLRERMVGIGVAPYVASKLVVLLLVSLLQTAFAVVVVSGFEGVPGNPLLYGLVFLSATLSGLSLGLLISSVASTSEQSTASMPLVLIPQIVFAGFILDVERMNAPSRAASYLISTRFSYEALKYTFQERYYDLVLADVAVVLGFTLLCTLLSMGYLAYRDR